MSYDSISVSRLREALAGAEDPNDKGLKSKTIAEGVWQELMFGKFRDNKNRGFCEALKPGRQTETPLVRLCTKPEAASSSIDKKCPDLNFRALGLYPQSQNEFFIFTGNTQYFFDLNEVPRKALDGSKFAVISNGKQPNVEVHWGDNQDERYILFPQKDKTFVAESLIKDADGKTYADRHIRFENGNGTTEFHVVNGASDYESPRSLRFYKHNDGILLFSAGRSRPSDSFLLLKDKSGCSAITLDRAGEELRILSHSSSSSEPEIAKAGKLLLAEMETRHSDNWSFAKLKVNMMRLESDRFIEMTNNFARAGIKKDLAEHMASGEIAQTYYQALKLLQAPNKLKDASNEAFLTPGRLAAACAEQIIDHAANPHEITQGAHPTCSLSSLENRVYSRYPSKAARLVVDFATSGFYRSSLSSKIAKVDDGSLLVHTDAKAYVPQDADRGIASQIFQVGAANLMYECNAQNFRYEQGEPSKEAPDGDRLFDKKGNFVQNFPENNHDWLLKTASEIIGIIEPAWILRSENLVSSKLSPEIDSATSLERAVKRAAETGNLPLAMRVYTDHEPLYTESGSRKKKEDGGAHLLSIRGQNKYGLEIDNQWSSTADHFGKRSVNAKETFELMKNPLLLRGLRFFGIDPEKKN